MKLRPMLRSLAATLALVGLVVGFPLLLFRVAGSPLPDHLPGWEAILDALTTRDDGSLLVGAMEFLAWGAWASFSFSVVGELIGRVRGVRLGWLPGFFGMRRLAAFLIASAAVAVTAPAATAATPAAPVVAAAPLHPAAVPNQIMYRIAQGDTLWGIADDKLGSGRRWPQIWKVNAHSRQPDGRVFRDPDLIYPGWRVRIVLPPKPTAKVEPTPPPSTTPVTSTSSSPSSTADDDAQTMVLIRLPSGSLVTLSYLAGISTAMAMTKLLQQRRGTAREKVAPAVREAHRAHTFAHVEHDVPVPTDRELLQRRQERLDVPGQITVARDRDGLPIRLNLGGLTLGLLGAGPEDVLRYLINDLLQQASNFRTGVLIRPALAKRLLGSPGVPGLTLADDADRRFEELVFTRQRMFVEREAESIDQLRAQDPGEALPVVVLISDQEPPRPSAATGTGVIVLGPCLEGITCTLDGHHRVVSATGTDAHLLDGAELCHITSAESTQHVAVLAEPTEFVDAPQEQAVWSGPELVRVSLLGLPMVQVRGQAKVLDLSWLQLNMLAYLALHPEGAANGQLATALWPDEVGKAIHNTLRHLREALVTATRYVNPDPKTAPFIGASTTKRTAVYRLDQQLVRVDLRDYQAALHDAKIATNTTDRRHALERAAELCRGELLQGLDAEWIDEHRYALTRSQADTLTRLADLCADEDPDHALELLERVRMLEPGAEEIYLQIIQLQITLGRRHDARRTAALLRRDLDDLGARPSRQTEEAIQRLLSTESPTPTR